MSEFTCARDGSEVQALARTGFGQLTHCRYLLLAVVDAGLASAWLAKLLALHLIKSVNDLALNKNVAEAVQIAFSHAGLDALRLPVDSDYPFPTIFAGGMAAPERAPMLGDRDRSAWKWGDVDSSQTGPAVHLLVAHYWCDPLARTSELLDPARLLRSGLQLVRKVETCPSYVARGIEPFGFADGVSQPRVVGLHPNAKGPNAVPAGEFLLGHLNAYGERAYSPDAKDFGAFAAGRQFGANGSYVAVRQIWQDVAALEKFDPGLAHAKDKDPPTPFERIIGRRKSGTPIVACPVGKVSKEDNEFLFRVDDYEGFHCPRGAHVRRGNPRDGLGWDRDSGVFAAKLHRLIRRGRVYQDAPVVPSDDGMAQAECGDGLFFVALNADLERQFEFVQRHWMANSKFADLWDESDALGGSRDFSIPGYMPVGERVTGLPQFTRVVGGGYFFMPSLSALRFLAKRAWES